MATKKALAKNTAASAAKKVASATTKKTATTKKMTKAKLVRLVAENMEITKKQSAALFELLAEIAVQETKENGVFRIPGLGKLVKEQRAARLGHNPQTGESIKIKAKTTVRFRVFKAAKDIIAPAK